MKKARLIASYLPQFHPIPENDAWWGKGFTEWTNVGKAEKLFKGHYQPRVPADLGYYDLRLPQVQIEQSELALDSGIESFCYWHYWFGNGRRILEMPFNRHVENKEIRIGFCLGWANESWSGIWHGAGNKILMEQLYPGKQDYIEHFKCILPALKDERYTKVKGKPLFMVYKPALIKDPQVFFETFTEQARQHGFDGMYFVAQTTRIEEMQELLAQGYDSVNVVRMYDIERLGKSKLERGIKHIILRKIRVYEYEGAIKYMSGEEDHQLTCIPTIVPNWDHSPRSGARGFILNHSTPELFEKHASQVIASVQHKPADERVVFVKSWNEWGEGNYLEPDLRYGRKYLEALKECVKA
ncbi:MAG: glycoside hydrolase family 99-like domain-containing protein [Bacteroidota bacterium]